MGLRITAIGGRISAFHLTPTSPRRLPGVGGFLLAAPILFGLAVHGGTVFQHACALGCEGIVSKRLGSPYRSGRVRPGAAPYSKAAGSWIKTSGFASSPQTMRVPSWTIVGCTFAMSIGSINAQTDGRVVAMSKRSLKKRRSKAIVPALGITGLSLSLASGAIASTGEATTNFPSTSQPHGLFLSEEEISDVSFATPHGRNDQNPHDK